MLNRKLSSLFYPNPTGDLGRDRNAKTVQITCFLFALTIGIMAAVDTLLREWELLPILDTAVVSLVVATVMNRAGTSTWAARIAILTILITAVVLVFDARDGFRSNAMLLFPGLLLLSVMLLDRVSYLTAAGLILLSVAVLGVTEKHGLTRAIPGVRTPTSYQSIFFVDLFLLAFATVGSRIVRDTQSNVLDLHASIDRLSSANVELIQVREQLQQSQERVLLRRVNDLFRTKA
jgi:hypothetical protein